uniref:Bidirectional sugar transporter SWEET n=4 Tax=Aegilops tauschii TaxID=37682 RepID=A0A453MPL4_AEGTS
NILGFAFGVIQMGLYAIYCNATPTLAPKEVDRPLPEHVINVAKLGPTATIELNMPAAVQPPTKENIVACASGETKEISVEKVDMATNVEHV